ncbi:HPr family phosphocarrier protein [Magnetospirillum sp. SS-4]|uniref:HPr family phosphocarrier protein n=1 Tax=Magnetospirillum sp. SS-4 TaxID=2681465 RepID=UPI00137E02C1|nr:HPr family phosphocarrier protein [Magnetospirillum sp. SS-4]CAA7623381.1 Phosphocarrier protein NPr [Magnetospirillum sp. SS-4]
MTPEALDSPDETGPRRSATIANRRGLHARAAAKFVKLAATFDAQVIVGHRGTEVSGLSIMGLMMLAAAPGCCIDLRASGNQAEAVLDALCDLIDRKFDED